MKHATKHSTTLSKGPLSAEVKKVASEFVAFINKAVTPYHAVEESAKLLKAAGFKELNEGDSWKIEPQQKYFLTKNRTAIFAFAVGGKYKPGNGFSIVAAHTDSPALRIKPVSKLCADNFLQVGVSTYGGGIWRTWFDRDFSIAGQIIYRKDQKLVQKLVNVAKPVLFIPNLAIHFCTERNKFECNNETMLRPIIASFVADGLNKPEEGENHPSEGDVKDASDIQHDHHSVLLNLIAKEAGCAPQDIVDMDLYVYDHQPATIGGVYDEFISSQRLDNLVGTFTAIRGIIDSVTEGITEFGNDENIRIASCYDNEECGSESAQGAKSHFTEWVLRRLAAGGSQTAFEEAIAKSFMISADQAHTAHPNYRDKHEDNHRPKFHGGVVVKVNMNQRYATTGRTHAVLKEIAHLASCPLQKIVVRNDMPCGTTVGPLLSSNLGLQTVDVGCGMLAMHSIRELTCTSSISQAIALYSVILSEFNGNVY
uniref:Aspartyl aminopeptidase n=1 Tax=Ascaris lumbricoides TaxID=6252 RepID=A0A9J2PNC3_ASCLU